MWSSDDFRSSAQCRREIGVLMADRALQASWELVKNRKG